MLVFGLVPMREATAHAGIIATSVALVMLGILSVILDMLGEQPKGKTGARDF
jgi:hypothetical protein